MSLPVPLCEVYDFNGMNARVSRHQQQQREIKQRPTTLLPTHNANSDWALWRLSQVLAEIAATQADSV